jgi:aryl-alcohol dehydrogenase-like predicted oxidoreductase
MPPGESTSIPQHQVSPLGPRLSLLGITVLPPPTPGPAGDRSVVERLRRARGAGVTTFDVADSPDPRQAERLLSLAFPLPDPDLTVIVGRRLEDLVRPGESGSRGSSAVGGVSERLRATLEESDRRLAPNHLGIVDWTDRDLPAGLDWENATRDLSGDSPPWIGRRITPETDLTSLPRERFPCLGILSGNLSLLDTRLVPLIGAQEGREVETVLVRDPFAGGRLDGSRWVGSAVARGPDAGPIRLRDVQAEFEPVLRLAYLTEGRQRTLAQAALRYAGHWPWVGSILVPLPTSDRLAEVLGAFATPPLTEAEIQRVNPGRRSTRAPAT